MIRLTNVGCIDAPVEKVWAVLADLEAVDRWVEPIKRAHCGKDKSYGVGASRVCELSNGLSVTEHWTEWEEGRSFAYEASGMPMVRRATNRWTLHSENGKTLVTSEAEIVLKGGLFSRPLEFLMRPMMKSLGPRTLAALSYFVEHGEPFTGKHKKLPLAPMNC